VGKTGNGAGRPAEMNGLAICGKTFKYFCFFENKCLTPQEKYAKIAVESIPVHSGKGGMPYEHP
jgi:hypothetical protein